MRNVRLLTSASSDTDRPATESEMGPAWVGPSAQSHSGYPTAAMFHGLSLGDGPIPGATVGNLSRATAIAAAWPAVMRGWFPRPEKVSERNWGAIGGVPQPALLTLGSRVCTQRVYAAALRS